MGSLAFTGRGHATDKAVILGLSGVAPETVDPDAAEALAAGVRATNALRLAGRRAIAFDPASAIGFERLTPAPRHPNTLRLVARDAEGAALADETWLSVGGGFIVRDGADAEAARPKRACPIPFARAPSFWRERVESGLTIAELMRSNEAALRPEAAVDAMSRASSTSCSPASTGA